MLDHLIHEKMIILYKLTREKIKNLVFEQIWLPYSICLILSCKYAKKILHVSDAMQLMDFSVEMLF
jgi:hypothetical protein